MRVRVVQHLLPGVQGEIDVIGIRLGRPQDIYFVEVTTHIQGMTYGGNRRTVEKVREKLLRAQAFAEQRFPGDSHHYQIWSPRVPEGAMTAAFEEMRAEFAERGEDLSFVINSGYGDRLQELVAWQRQIAERPAIRHSASFRYLLG